MARKAAAATSTSDDAAAPRRSGRIAAIPSAVQETAKKVVKKATGKKRGADGEGDAGANKKVKADDEPADGAASAPALTADSTSVPVVAPAAEPTPAPLAAPAPEPAAAAAQPTDPAPMDVDPPAPPAAEPASTEPAVPAPSADETSTEAVAPGDDAAPTTAKAPPLALGDALPSITLQNEKGEDVDVAALAAERGLVLFLVPKADTPGCTNQACGFRDIYPDFEAAGYGVYCLSADTPAAQAKWQTKKNLPYPLLSDRKRVLIGALGAADGAKTKRSHFIFGKGGVLLERVVPVKPNDSPKLALEFIKKQTS